MQAYLKKGKVKVTLIKRMGSGFVRCLIQSGNRVRKIEKHYSELTDKQGNKIKPSDLSILPIVSWEKETT